MRECRRLVAAGARQHVASVPSTSTATLVFASTVSNLGALPSSPAGSAAKSPHNTVPAPAFAAAQCRHRDRTAALTRFQVTGVCIAATARAHTAIPRPIGCHVVARLQVSFRAFESIAQHGRVP